MIYSKIQSPETNKSVSIHSSLGKKILKKYLQSLIGGTEEVLKINKLNEYNLENIFKNKFKSNNLQDITDSMIDMEVTLPENVRPNQKLYILAPQLHGNTKFEITVPPGSVGGQTIKVRIPTILNAPK